MLKFHIINNLKISIIGYKNHALRLRRIIYNLGYKSVIMFNHNQDDIADISACDIFIIASPNESHTEWIKTIRSLGKDKYIFCEKPPATDHQQLNQVKSFDPKIYFNFNYRHSLLAELIKKYIGNNKIGKVIHATFTSSHGLAFNKAYLSL